MADTKKQNDQITQEKKKTVKKRRRWPLWVLLGLVVVIAAAAIASALVFDHYFDKLGKADSPTQIKESLSPEDEAWKQELDQDQLAAMDEALEKSLAAAADWDFADQRVKNILLIGVDNDYAGGMDQLGNADGLIIVSINEDTKRVALNSIMRDSYVSVPGRYNTKITLTYHFGGVDLLREVMEANFGVPIDNYMLVNYPDLIQIVDAMGGVEMDVTADELYWMQPKIENLNEILGRMPEQDVLSPTQAGTLLLNGVQTAAYLRIRYAGNGDFDRTTRARNVLLALKDKAAAMSLTELNEMANVVLPCVKTDLSEGEVLSLLLSAPSYLQYEMESNRIPIDGTWGFADAAEAGAVVTVDYKANRDFLYNSIYGNG